MTSRLSDQEILAILTEKIGDLSERVGYDGRNYLNSMNLSALDLSQLPPEIGQLSNLQTLNLQANSELLTPPPEVVTSGTKAILEFLQELHKDGVIRYEAKLLVVGEGGTGKTSLLKSLRNEAFDQELSTTHGIEVN